MAKYSEAIEWIAHNDDTEFVKDENPSLSVNASMVADLWNKSHEQVLKDIRKELKKVDNEHRNY